MVVSPLAGKPAPRALLVNVASLVADYFAVKPDRAAASERVHVGTSGRRGSATAASFNEAHIVSIAQAVCLSRRKRGIDGPLFLGRIRMRFPSPLSSAPSRCWRPMAWRRWWMPLAGTRPHPRQTCAVGGNEPIDGIKVTARSGWFAARPSGTEDVYKIYAESFRSEGHLQ